MKEVRGWLLSQDPGRENGCDNGNKGTQTAKQTIHLKEDCRSHRENGKQAWEAGSN